MDEKYPVKMDDIADFLGEMIQGCEMIDGVYSFDITPDELKKAKMWETALRERGDKLTDGYHTIAELYAHVRKLAEGTEI